MARADRSRWLATGAPAAWAAPSECTGIAQDGTRLPGSTTANTALTWPAEITPRALQPAGPHVAPLGLQYWPPAPPGGETPGVQQWPTEFADSFFNAQHGSWNRQVRSSAGFACPAAGGGTLSRNRAVKRVQAAPRHGAAGIRLLGCPAAASLSAACGRCRCRPPPPPPPQLPIGYRVMSLRLNRTANGGIAAAQYVPFATGWLRPDGTSWGRPTGLARLPDGSLLVGDNRANCVYRISYTPPPPPPTPPSPPPKPPRRAPLQRARSLRRGILYGATRARACRQSSSHATHCLPCSALAGRRVHDRRRDRRRPHARRPRHGHPSRAHPGRPLPNPGHPGHLRPGCPPRPSCCGQASTR